jgi:hypothetical protein
MMFAFDTKQGWKSQKPIQEVTMFAPFLLSGTVERKGKGPPS